MVRKVFKWKFGCLFSILLLNVFTKSLPIAKSGSSFNLKQVQTELPSLVSTDTQFGGLLIPEEIAENVHVENLEAKNESDEEKVVHRSNETIATENEDPVFNATETAGNTARNLLRQNLRPGQDIRYYSVDITIDGGVFRGRCVLDVRLETDTREDGIVLHAEDMTINSVQVGVFSEAASIPSPFDYDADDGILEIFPDTVGSTYVVIIEYTAPIRNDGTGIFMGQFNNQEYLGMNAYPTYARRVFPCVDELLEISTVLLTFNNVPFTNMIANSEVDPDNANQFQATQNPVHLWGMVAHNFPTVMIPATNVIMYGRTGLNQDAQASVAIQYIFNALNEWTNKPYFEILANQDGRMAIFALPDTNVEWNALSTICIWEPYLYMATGHSIMQRKTGFIELGAAMARQWFGFVIYPENWRHQWVLTGLNTFTVHDILKEFQTDPLGLDVTLLDMNTIFVTDIIQESLLRDGYANAMPLLLSGDIFEPPEVREYINGLMKYKAPTIMWMLRLILGNPDIDHIQMAAQTILNRMSLEPVTTLDFYDSINAVLGMQPSVIPIDDVEEFLEPWITSRGYPLLHVGLTQGGLLVTQQQFGFTAQSVERYLIPITYTSSMEMGFDNIHPIFMMDNTMTIQMMLDEDERDFVLFNIQGQGYYRVNYDAELWERIIECLEEPDCREQIHPLNRATLIDDALNLARAGSLDYDIAFRVVLTWEHELDYAPWKAFIRSMNFLKTRLEAFVFDDEDLDPDIYLRMVQRTIGRVEDELTFYPDILTLEPAMATLTRGIVMEQACRAGYQPCIAAAIDWFYDPDSSEPTVNPNIPTDIRPAVFCAMVKEGDANVINALYNRLDIETSHYDRLVILESLACSLDESFISSLLLETIADGSRYGVAERSKIFTAVASSNPQNTRVAISFMAMRTMEVRNMYGGEVVLEELIRVLAENAGDQDLTFDLQIWINSINSNLDDSIDVAEKLRDMAIENTVWDQMYRDYVYEWIDENDAPRIVLSVVLLGITLLVTLFNH